VHPQRGWLSYVVWTCAILLLGIALFGLGVDDKTDTFLSYLFVVALVPVPLWAIAAIAVGMSTDRDDHPGVILAPVHVGFAAVMLVVAFWFAGAATQGSHGNYAGGFGALIFLVQFALLGVLALVLLLPKRTRPVARQTLLAGGVTFGALVVSLLAIRF